MAHFAGLVAGGTHPSPFPHAHVATTTTHKTLRGPRGGMILTNDKKLAKKFNSAIFPGIQGGPLMHVIAGKAVAFADKVMQPKKRWDVLILPVTKTVFHSIKRNSPLHRAFALVPPQEQHVVLEQKSLS